MNIDGMQVSGKRDAGKCSAVQLVTVTIIIYLIYINLTYFVQIYTCMCVYLYIHNKYTKYTHTLCKQKLLFWMR